VLRHSAVVAGASFTPSHIGRRNLIPAGLHERDMFLYIFECVMQANSVVFEFTSDGARVVKALEVFRNLAKVGRFIALLCFALLCTG
jgi:hypothetical protein